ncbi:hypothetical protein EVAR_12095_1 [Eumeta japonica]|uniref:Uncharacterized protein n=1 Tax=Eumeta variegata TaxID=151549 RepID=A0A4C1U697_EUMVA|nr:hypothetical protein EVAR_12095_1 [Eumeta japonica]
MLALRRASGSGGAYVTRVPAPARQCAPAAGRSSFLFNTTQFFHASMYESKVHSSACLRLYSSEAYEGRLNSLADGVIAGMLPRIVDVRASRISATPFTFDNA